MQVVINPSDVRRVLAELESGQPAELFLWLRNGDRPTIRITAGTRGGNKVVLVGMYQGQCRINYDLKTRRGRLYEAQDG